MSRLHRLFRLILRPRFLFARLRGLRINVEMYILLNQKWLKRAGIKTVLDIGANVGQFAYIMRDLFPGAFIHSFEPLPSVYEELQKNLSRIENIKTYNLALGDAREHKSFYQNEFAAASSSLPLSNKHKSNYPQAQQVNEITVEQTRLDDISFDTDKLEENILIKIDVQGTENEVIRGGERIINKASILIIETCFQPLYEGQKLFDDIYQILHENFHYVGSLGPPRIDGEDGSPLFEDSIFVNKKFKKKMDIF